MAAMGLFDWLIVLFGGFFSLLLLAAGGGLLWLALQAGAVEPVVDIDDM